MKGQIKTKQKNKPKNILRLYKFIGKIILKYLDGSVPYYMSVYTYYIKIMGLKLYGKPLYICADLKIDGSDYSEIRLHEGIVISSEVRLLTHDYSINKVLDKNVSSEIRKISPITIKKNAFIGLRSTILPGVSIGENSIVGACSVVTKDVGDNCVVAGNPAKFICSIDDYSKKIKEDFVKNNSVYYKE